MNQIAHEMTRVAFIGIGATAALDLWILVLRQMNVPTLDFALLGRWVGHLARGTWGHKAIAKASPVRAERAIGWLAHYAVGIVFAGVFVAIAGIESTGYPSLLAAVVFGMSTVIVPLFVMQPAMGAGFASSRTPTPARNCLRSVVNHSVFGGGLYLAAVAIAWVAA